MDIDLEVCLFSPSGQGEGIIELIRATGRDKTRYLALSNSLGKTHLDSAVLGVDAVANLYPASTLANWSLSIAHLLMRDMRPKTRKMFVNADFASQNRLPLRGFIDKAMEHDFYTASGRFSQEDGTFDFPTWECCAISPKMWTDAGFRTFVANVANGLDLEGQLYIEREFYEQFYLIFDMASAVEGQTSDHFDPVNDPEISIGALLKG